jgi:putative membrane protein
VPSNGLHADLVRRSTNPKGKTMYRTTAIAACVAAGLASAGAIAAAAKPTDPQIAHIAYTAGQLDIEAGKQALDKSKNKDVRAFAQRMVGDHTAVNDQALALSKS